MSNEYYSCLPTVIQRYSKVFNELHRQEAFSTPFAVPQVFTPPEILKRCVNLDHVDCTTTTGMLAFSAVRFYYQFYSHPCMMETQDARKVMNPTFEDNMNRTKFYGSGNNLVPVIDWSHMNTVQDIESFTTSAINHVVRMMVEFEKVLPRSPQPWDHTSGLPMPCVDRARGWLPTEIALFRFYADVRKANITEGVPNKTRLIYQFRCNEWFIVKMFMIDAWQTALRKGQSFPPIVEQAKLMMIPTPSIDVHVPHLKNDYEFYSLSRDPNPEYCSKIGVLLGLERQRFSSIQGQLDDALQREILHQRSQKTQEAAAAAAGANADSAANTGSTAGDAEMPSSEPDLATAVERKKRARATVA